MADKELIERRAGQRLSLLGDAEIILGDGASIPAQLDELSSRGCYLDTLEPVPVGTEFRLRIGDDGQTCELQGGVIYAHSGGGLGVFGLGVIFTKMSFQQSSAINSWLHELASK